MTLVNSGPLMLAVLAALGYAVATIGMKLGSASMTLAAIILIGLGMTVAAISEISILRNADLGVVYITILGLETLIVLGVAAMLGEGLDLRQISGAGLVFLGLLIVVH